MPVYTGLDIPRYVNIIPIPGQSVFVNINNIVSTSTVSVSSIAKSVRLSCWSHEATRVLQTSPRLVVFGLAKKPRSQIVKVIKFCVRKEDNEGVIQSHMSLFSDADADASLANI